MREKFEELIEGFITNSVGVSDSFISLPLAAALRQNLEGLNNNKLMVSAGIGNALQKDKHQTARTDKTCWLDEQTTNIAEMEFFDIIAQFSSYLNQTCYTGINACEFHYALYEQGAAYTRHRDQFKSNDSRKFSMISYLNEDWIETDGGHLVIHRDDDSVQHIMPSNCKTVFFKSDETEHEVVIAMRPRMSLTGWLKRV